MSDSIVPIAVVTAYLIAYPFFALTYYDIGRFPRQLWSGNGHPRPWRQATVLTYLLGGLPVVITALVWRTSRIRSEMRATAHRRQRA